MYMYMTEIILHMVTSFEWNSPTYGEGEVQSLLQTNTERCLTLLSIELFPTVVTSWSLPSSWTQ